MPAVTQKSCGNIAEQWSSPRTEGSRTFEVNMRAMRTIKSVGKGSTAFWSFMNILHRKFHHKTFQKRIEVFRGAASEAAQNVFSDAVAAVCELYKGMDPGFDQNITVVCSGTWITHGHTSHISVGIIIEFYSGLIIGSVAVSDYCHGCMLGPKESDDEYGECIEQHICQKKT